MSKIPSIDLLQAGLDMMRNVGKALKPISSPGRAMMYALPNGETVRVRTCNDHILIVLADSVKPDARLNIEGSDHLLIVMPEVPRTPGKVLAYLVPTDVATKAARDTHQAWLETNPNTKGANTTWNLRFNDGSKMWESFSRKWAHYRLGAEANIPATAANEAEAVSSKSTEIPVLDFRAEVDAARQRISRAAGVSLDAVKITIEFGL